MIRKILALTFTFFLLIGALVAQPNKVVLIEEATGTWCAWCPKGKVFGEKLLHDYEGKIIFIEVHGNDPMENEEYDEESRFWIYPSGHINRKTNQLHLEPERWENIYGRELNTLPPANVHVETVYDTSSRNLTVNISADFFETLSGDYRLAAIVVEDGVTGDEERYGQSNVYSENRNGAMGGFEILPAFISSEMMVYDHVGRHLLGGYTGARGSLPEEINAGNTYTYSYDWTLPDEYDKDFVWVTALLLNTENGEVLNAGRSIYISGNTNPKPFFVSKPVTQVLNDHPYSYNVRYHDSNNDSYEIKVLEPLPEWLEFQNYTHGFAELKGTPKDTGVYEIALRLTDGEHTVDQSFQIVVEEFIPPPVSRVDKDFLIMPNPNDGTFNLEFDKGTHYQVFDSSGRKVDEGNLLRNIYDKFFIQPINLGNLNSGLYFLKVFDSRDYINTKTMLVIK